MKAKVLFIFIRALGVKISQKIFKVNAYGREITHQSLLNERKHDFASDNPENLEWLGTCFHTVSTN